MKLHLIDGTFELFRAYFGPPKARGADGGEVGATKGFLRSMQQLVDGGATHVGVAFDHVIESFRNDLFAGYKTGAGIEPDLWRQHELVEEAAAALGLTVWPMVEFEADDAMAAAAAQYGDDPRVEQIILCSPDKDLAQAVRGERVVMYDRIRRKTTDEAGVREKWGIEPASIPDWLALVGDKADGIPGIPRWGAKSASTVLAEYGSIEQIPSQAEAWTVKVRGAATLSANLEAQREDAALYRVLATLRTDVPLGTTVDDLEVRGPDWERLEALCEQLDDRRFYDRLAEKHGRV